MFIVFYTKPIIKVSFGTQKNKTFNEWAVNYSQGVNQRMGVIENYIQFLFFWLKIKYIFFKCLQTYIYLETVFIFAQLLRSEPSFPS